MWVSEHIGFHSWWAGASRVFFTPSVPAGDEMQVHLGLCNTVVDMMSYWSFELHGEMDASHWEGLQYLIVSLVHELLSKNDSTQVQTLAEQMSGPLMNLLLVTWIRSPVTTEEMWANLSSNLTGLLNWKAVILQWQEKLLFVTGLLLGQFYGDAAALNERRKTTTFQLSDVAKGPKDPKLLSLDWTNERTYSMWFTLLRLLGNPVNVVVGELFQMAMGCVAAVLELLLEAQRAFFPTLKEGDPPINLFEVFCPWLFDATAVDGKRGRGAIVAYTMLCEMFLQMGDRSFDVGLMSHFYRVLISGLNGGHSSIAWCILRAGRALFHLNLPGVEVLIPSLLDQMDLAFSAKTVKVQVYIYF